MKPLEQLNDDELAAAGRRAGRQLPDAPAVWIARAEALMPGPVAGAVARAGEALRRLAATLTFDSRARPALGMRGDTGTGRQLLFSAEGRDIDLRIVGGHGVFTLAGQVLGPDEAGTARLDAGDGAGRTATLDAFGEFRFDNVAAGRAVLTLHLGDDEIALPPIELG
jgi:hypothetical protein